MKHLCTIFAVCVLIYSDAVISGDKRVSKEMFGDKWPLIVDSGVVRCVSRNAVVFIANGKTYALNGFAKSSGYSDIRPIWKDDESFLEMVKIIAKQENISEEEAIRKMGELPKINIGPLIDAGLELCG